MIDMLFPKPNWQPLKEVVGPSGCDNFLYMGVAIFVDKRIHLYKHRETRRYLNIDEEGRCYQYQPNTSADGDGDTYVLIPTAWAVAAGCKGL